MALREILDKINELQAKIESFGQLDKDTLKRIQYRFRLDWNYHSNAMEGNSLTQSETRSVMINNVTVEGKPLKDVLEIRGHDKVITDILRIGKGDLRLSETRIKDIHKAIISEDNPEQQKKIGQWKTTPNHLINYKGEKFEFVPPAEVPEQMHILINWLNTQRDLILNKSETALHPVLLAFHFHLRYVSIHPFYDGNGRTARILTNLILISFGYPPVIIEIENKNVYGQYLADIQGYGGGPELYHEFMCKQLIKSQELVIMAIEGVDIEQPEDIDKKILLLEKELEAVSPENEVKERFNKEVFEKMFETWIIDLLRKAIPLVQKFNKFFTGTNHHIYLQSGGANVFSHNFIAENPEKVIEDIKQKLLSSKTNFHTTNTKFHFQTFYGTLIKGGLNTFGCNYGFDIDCEYIKYEVLVDEFPGVSVQRKVYRFKERLLHQPFSPTEIDKLVMMLGDAIYNHIDYNTKKSGIR
ncbi:MAG: Fic family protein [Sphingobacteriaceae bacterium]